MAIDENDPLIKLVRKMQQEVSNNVDAHAVITQSEIDDLIVAEYIKINEDNTYCLTNKGKGEVVERIKAEGAKR